jgi:hypothetical protein
MLFWDDGGSKPVCTRVQVQKLGKMMTCVANSVKIAEEQQKLQDVPNNLGNALSACMNSSTPPVTRQVSALRPVFARCSATTSVGSSPAAVVVRCSITGAVLEVSTAGFISFITLPKKRKERLRVQHFYAS